MKAHILISGFVHGVGYRQFVKKKALELGLTGWVTNLPDKKVEAVFIGDRSAIEEMIKELHKGTFLSKINNMDIEWAEDDRELEGFEVIH